MPTPEEIMADEYSKLIVNWEKAYRQHPCIFKAAHTAMNVYAQQKAIEFVEWKDKNFITTIGGDSDVKSIYRPRFMNLAGENKFTAAELYQLFKQQKP